jgi:hypothetical protein
MNSVIQAACIQAAAVLVAARNAASGAALYAYCGLPIDECVLHYQPVPIKGQRPSLRPQLGVEL